MSLAVHKPLSFFSFVLLIMDGFNGDADTPLSIICIKKEAGSICNRKRGTGWVEVVPVGAKFYYKCLLL